MVTVLAIDTAGPNLQLALWRADGCDTLVEPMAQGHAERLFPAIAELLARAGSAYSELGRIAVTTGPGSFTGVRIGLSAARGLGLGLAIPVLGIDTFSAVSLLAPDGLEVSVVMDARRGEMYAQQFHGPLAAVGERQWKPIPAEEVFARACNHVLGSGAAATALATGATDLELDRPEAARGRIDIALVAAWAASADPAAWPPDPAYGREADAKPQHRFRVARAEPA